MIKTRYLEYVQFQGLSRISRIIRKWTRDNDSHSAVLDRERAGEDQLIEQWPHDGGVKSWMDYNSFHTGHTPGTPYTIWSLAVPSSDYDWIMNRYRESANMRTPYDWSGIWAFGTHGAGDPDKTFCSEEMITHLADRMVLNGKTEWGYIKPVTVHPGYFRNLLIASGARQTGGGVV